jgi:hypothetical protein
MGLLNFFKAKTDPAEDVAQADRMRRNAWLAGVQTLGKEVENLRSEGRDEEANKLIAEYLSKVLEEFKAEPENPQHLSLLAHVAIGLGALQEGKQALESALEAKHSVAIDLTLPYLQLGRVHHQLGEDPKRELWCFETAAEAKTPPGCKFPATRQQKAMAHYYAHFVALRIAQSNPDDPHSAIAQSHITRARRLLPELNWDDPSHVSKLIEQLD